MRSGFSLCRARLAASATALLGLSVAAGCQDKRPPEPAPAAAPEINIPDPVAAPAAPEPGLATTLAIGEEDGGYGAPTEPGMVTTFAVGEEDGSGPFPVEPDGGIGDGAGPPLGGFPTTEAIGEEDGDAPQIYIPPDPDTIVRQPGYGQATTLAIGEEG